MSNEIKAKHEALLARIYAADLGGVTADIHEDMVRVARVQLCSTNTSTTTWLLRYTCGAWCNAYSGAPIGQPGTAFVSDAQAEDEIVEAIAHMRAVKEFC